jgi:outer membrane protein assembly factor BamB
MKNLLRVMLFLFASMFVFASAASATEIVLDTEHHHLGDDFKEELNPGAPEGLIYTATFTLGTSVDMESAELTLTGKSIVPGPTGEFLDKIYLNDIEIGSLNDYVPTGTPDSDSVNITIPVHPSFFDPGNNTIRISSGSDANGSNYDDFEFYDLSLHLNEIEPVTLAPPLKVAWTHEFPWRCIDGIPEIEILAADGVLYLDNGFGSYVTAIDAETGESLWDRKFEWNDQMDYMEYGDGILFVIHFSTIDALNGKTGELLWSQEYPDFWGNPLTFGNTLFVNMPYSSYVAAIDVGNGNLKWKHELNTTDSVTGSIDSCEIFGPQTNGKVIVFVYYFPSADNGLIALDTKTGKEVWRYTNLTECYNDPFFYKDLIYIEDQGDIIALSSESGKEIWKRNIGSWGDIVEVKNNKLFIDSYRPIILDASTGKTLKEFPYSELHFSSSVTTDKYIYSTGEYNIKVFNSSTGESVWNSSRIKGAVVSDPVLYKDKLYLISSEGILYAFEHGKAGLFFTRGLEGAAILYFPPIAVAGMLLLLTILVRKYENKVLVFGSWLIALVGVLLLSFIAIEPYIRTLEVLGILPFLVFCSLAVILLFGVVFLIYGLRKRRK